MPHRCNGALHQDRVSALHHDRLDGAVRRDLRFNLYDPANVHGLRNGRVGRRSFDQNLPDAIGWLLSSGVS